MVRAGKSHWRSHACATIHVLRLEQAFDYCWSWVQNDWYAWFMLSINKRFHSEINEFKEDINLEFGNSCRDIKWLIKESVHTWQGKSLLSSLISSSCIGWIDPENQDGENELNGVDKCKPFSAWFGWGEEEEEGDWLMEKDKYWRLLRIIHCEVMRCWINLVVDNCFGEFN